MINKASFVISLCFVGVLVACAPPPVPGRAVTASKSAGQPGTATAAVTGTFKAVLRVPTGTTSDISTAVFSPSPAVQRTKTAAPSPTGALDFLAVTVEPGPTAASGDITGMGSPQAELKCDAAQAGRPLDLTVPDDSAFQPGERFTKVWRVVNTGACTWDPNYSVVWFSGDDLGLTWTQPIGQEVPPGQAIDLSVDMAAPETPGVYQSNWKLLTSHGSLFGIGPDSDTPFWVRIVVNPAHTPTPEPTAFDPTAAAPPVILAQGLRTLALDEGIDLNIWSGDEAVTEDLRLVLLEETGTMALLPLNEAGLAYFGLNRPSFSECLQAQVSADALALEDYPPGAYYCYRTADRMPGRMMLSTIDTHNSLLTLEYITWVVP